MGLLSSLKVLDFTTLLPGPYATLMLADLGADVLRVDAPNRQDFIRMLPPLDEYSSAAHSYLNRNKQSICLDLKNPAAVVLVRELVQEFDVIVEQFRPGVMDRLGIGYETLAELNPRVIFCSITGYGQTGPYRDRAGHDCNYLAMSGMSSHTGTEATGPLPAGFQIADVAGGSLHAVTGILAAVVHRQQTGEGQAIDISMTDAAFALNAMLGAGCLGGGVVPDMESHPLNGGGLYGYYQTSDGRWMSVGSLEPQFLHALCDALDIEMVEANGFGPAERDGGIRQKLRERFAQLTFADCRAIFAKLDACVEPVLNLREAAEHPLFDTREMIASVPTPDGKTQKQLAAPIKFSAHAPQYRCIGPDPGEHTEEVLKALGKSGEEICGLRDRGAFGAQTA